MAEKTMEQMMMGMMIAVMGIAIISQVLQVQAAPPITPTVYTCPYCGAEFASQTELGYHIEAEHPEAPPLGAVSVALKNLPAESTGWDLYLYGANGSFRRRENLAATEPAVWSDIAAEEFPFQITLDIWKIVPAPENLLYHVQSRFPDYMNYHPNLLIHALGTYNYNCATIEFELV